MYDVYIYYFSIKCLLHFTPTKKQAISSPLPLTFLHVWEFAHTDLLYFLLYEVLELLHYSIKYYNGICLIKCNNVIQQY